VITTSMNTDTRRSALLDKDLLYLFSYDADLQMRRDVIGFIPAGVRFDVSAFRNKTRVYNVARERTVFGSKAIEGTIVQGTDWPVIRPDDIGVLDVRLTIRTDDEATIFSRYRGVFWTGDGGYRTIVSGKMLGTEEKPQAMPVQITPRYETDDPRYAWLIEHQCVGFGQITIVDSKVRRGSFDIYAMDS
jgi:hypothetical protein